MTYQVIIGRDARKAIKRFPKTDQERIVKTLELISDNPRPPKCTPVRTAGPNCYRVRVGDYRIIYEVIDSDRAVIVARVARRSESTYKGLE